MTRRSVGIRIAACLTALVVLAVAWCVGAGVPGERRAPCGGPGVPTSETVATDWGTSLQEGDMLPAAALGVDEGTAAGAGDRVDRGRLQPREGPELAALRASDPESVVEKARASRATCERSRAVDVALRCVRREAGDPPCATAVSAPEGA